MSDFLLYASVVALFLVCILVVLVILMQRPSANAGMGAALGGGAAETVFGGESANVLSKMTTTLTVILFVLSFGLYLGFVAREKPSVKALDAAATAARGGFDDDWKANARRHANGAFKISNAPFRARNHGDPKGFCGFFRSDFIAHNTDVFGCRANKDNSVIFFCWR